MKRPHRQGGKGAIIRRQIDDRKPSRNSGHSQCAAPNRQQWWQSRNPKARWAHMCLQSALRRGLLERGPCAICGDQK
jgi:hypothetical protein